MEDIRKENFREIARRAEELADSLTTAECASLLLYRSPAIPHAGIPAYNWWNEALHGVARAGTATVFPQAIGLAASFDTGLLRKIGERIADEGRAKYNLASSLRDYGMYKGLSFWSPNVNLFRDPRWGRGQETYGEDPFLTGEMGAAFVEGLQGDGAFWKGAGCAKHFAVHSGPEASRHSLNAHASKRDLEESYLPQFRRLKEAGVAGFMSAYNRLNGEACSASVFLLKEILREKWGFDGYVTSDCGALQDIHDGHHLTGGATESAALALRSGCDLNCGSVYEHLMEALEEGRITEAEIRRSAKKLLEIRMRLGLFEKELPWKDLGISTLLSEEGKELNLRAARESFVLLKNSGLLPLKKEALRSLAVIGPNAASERALLGNYHGTPDEAYTIREGLRAMLPKEVRLFYSEGCHLWRDWVEAEAGDRLTEAVSFAREADLTILVTGFDESIEGEELREIEGYTGDRRSLGLPDSQKKLLRAISDTGKPFVILNLSGSTMDFGEAGERAEAIFQGWYPGAMGGIAFAELLFGDITPSGRLPISFYYEDAPLPPFEDYSMEGRTYKYGAKGVHWPFGYGLSYIKTRYSSLRFDWEKKFALCTVVNLSEREGDEVAELYLMKENSLLWPEKRLLAFGRVHLSPHETKEISLPLCMENLLGVTEDGERCFEDGEFIFYIGSSSDPSLDGAEGCRICRNLRAEEVFR